MLVAWRNAEASNATVEKLVTAHRNCFIDDSDCRDILLEAINAQRTQSALV